MDATNILAFYWRLYAIASTSIPLEARITILIQRWVTNAIAVFVVPNLVDCAVTSAASANSARWLDFTSHYLPLSFGFGINGYVIALDKWNQFTSAEQRVLSMAFAKQIQSSWLFAKDLYEDSVRIARSSSINDWLESCSKVYGDCKKEWLETIGSVLELN